MSFKSNLPFTFKIEKDCQEFHAWCPELTGCHTQGKTANIALENLKDAVQLYSKDIPTGTLNSLLKDAGLR